VVPSKTTECRSGNYPQTHGQRAAIVGNYTQQQRASDDAQLIYSAQATMQFRILENTASAH